MYPWIFFDICVYCGASKLEILFYPKNHIENRTENCCESLKTKYVHVFRQISKT